MLRLNVMTQAIIHKGVSNTLTSRLRNQKSRFLSKTVAIDPKLIIREEDGSFSVPSETKGDVTYSVNMDLRVCNCPHGRLKGPCKHRKIVSTSQNIPSFDIIPDSSPEMRAIWMKIGNGKETPISYFLPFQIQMDLLLKILVLI